jgi:phosphatidylinositol glycan class T
MEMEMILPPMDLGSDTPQIIQPSSGLVTPETPSLYAERSFTGHGQEHGGVQTILRNPSPDTEVEFIYMESLPWFMRIYLHTLEARIDGLSGKQNSLIQEVYYRPAQDRARGTQLEVRMRIPPASTVFLTYDFEKSILRYTEYPPDANRGFDVAAAVITILNPKSPSASGFVSGARFRTSNLRTTTLLLNLPTPDFSMPYNVIIFTSTAMAFSFGGFINILVRRFVAADEGPKLSLAQTKAKMRGGLVKLLAKLGKKKAD